VVAVAAELFAAALSTPLSKPGEQKGLAEVFKEQAREGLKLFAAGEVSAYAIYPEFGQGPCNFIVGYGSEPSEPAADGSKASIRATFRTFEVMSEDEVQAFRAELEQALLDRVGLAREDLGYYASEGYCPEPLSGLVIQGEGTGTLISARITPQVVYEANDREFRARAIAAWRRTRGEGVVL
jgi:hypothetical protein